ncbi:hypothetical protein VTH06DRAFT_7219 [Thermothelomyces fergusii]
MPPASGGTAGHLELGWGAAATCIALELGDGVLGMVTALWQSQKRALEGARIDAGVDHLPSMTARARVPSRLYGYLYNKPADSRSLSNTRKDPNVMIH